MYNSNLLELGSVQLISIVREVTSVWFGFGSFINKPILNIIFCLIIKLDSVRIIKKKKLNSTMLYSFSALNLFPFSRKPTPIDGLRSRLFEDLIRITFNPKGKGLCMNCLRAFPIVQNPNLKSCVSY